MTTEHICDRLERAGLRYEISSESADFVHLYVDCWSSYSAHFCRFRSWAIGPIDGDRLLLTVRKTRYR